MSRANAGKKKRILVTGGNGTLGYNVIARLTRNDKYSIVAPVRDLQARVVLNSVTRSNSSGMS